MTSLQFTLEITIAYSHIGSRIYRSFRIAVLFGKGRILHSKATPLLMPTWTLDAGWRLVQSKTVSKTVVSKQCYKRLCHKVITESWLKTSAFPRWFGLDSAPCSWSWSLPRICSQTQLGHHLSKAHTCGQDFEPLCNTQLWNIFLAPKWLRRLRLRSSPSGQSVPLICSTSELTVQAANSDVMLDKTASEPSLVCPSTGRCTPARIFRKESCTQLAMYILRGRRHSNPPSICLLQAFGSLGSQLT